MRLRLSELQESHDETRKFRAKRLKNIYEEVDRVLDYQKLPFVLKAIQIKFISQHHDDPLVGHFIIIKTREVISRKYYWSSLKKNFEAYIKGYDICLDSKTVRHKPYSDLQSLLSILTRRQKDFAIDFVTRLSISTNQKRDNYDFILVIVD